MQLITKEIAKKLQSQFPKGSDMDQDVIVKFFDNYGDWRWYGMNQDPNDPDYLWGIVKGFEIEIGSFSISELESLKSFGTNRIERDKFFKSMPAKELWDKLHRGENV